VPGGNSDTIAVTCGTARRRCRQHDRAKSGGNTAEVTGRLALVAATKEEQVLSIVGGGMD